MALPENLVHAVILKTQIIDDFKNGIAKGADRGSFLEGVAEITRLGVAALKKYTGE